MKKMLIPILLLAGIIGFCIWSTQRVEAVCEDAADLLAQAETRCALGDFEGAEALAWESHQLWTAREGFLGTALRHTESDDVAVLYPPLLETCRQRDGEEFTRRSLELRAILRQLSRMEIPYYFNVL